MVMFEWLEKELVEIKTRKFHLVDGPADETFRQEVASCKVPLPHSYIEFVLRFGNAKLYKRANYYKLGVLASPREERSKHDVYYRFGHSDSNQAYFMKKLLRMDEETPVFEGGEDKINQVAGSFEEWLTKRSMAARAMYKKSEWAEIVNGPPPFTTEESRIVEARRRFSWRAVGVTPEGDFLFEVHNGSDIMLPFLSIGVRWNDGTSEGGIKLPVSEIGPGCTSVVEREAYKKVVNPGEIEFFSLPDPGPEDRKSYWEFKRHNSGPQFSIPIH
jgi:hypothetical protein